MDRGSDGFQLVHDHGRFFRSNELCASGAAELVDHLLITLQVQRVLRLKRGQLLVKVAGPGQVPRLNTGGLRISALDYQTYAYVDGTGALTVVM